MSSDQAAKRLKTDDAASAITLATHNGHFHADEALAVHMLRTHVPEYANAKLVRTRNPAVLEAAHTVVDVGGQYDSQALRFDHHQRGFSVTFPGRPTKLSSAGLVYLHFGQRIVERKLASNDSSSSPPSESDTFTIFHKLYTNFVEALDAHDNGIDPYDPAALAQAGIEKRYQDGGFGLGAIVGRYNANWNDPTADAEGQAGEDARFVKASARIGEEFDKELEYLTGAWLPARSLVREAYESRKKYDAMGRVVVFENQSCPWKDHLYTEEAADKNASEEKVLYVLYPDKDNKWRIQCVPVSKDSFESRKPLPESWRGHRDAELDEIIANEGGAAVEPGAVFVHAAGFIGGHKSFDGAIQMVTKALD